MPSAPSSSPRLVALLLLGVSACTGSIDGPGGSGSPPGSPPSGSPGEPGNPAPGQPGNPANPNNSANPGGAPSNPGACAPPARRIWKLTPDQYSRSVEAV